MHNIRRYFIAGLLVWLPLWVTLLVISFLMDLFDKVVNLIPLRYQPDHLLGMRVPGIGLLFVLIVVFLTGIFAKNYLGNKIVQVWEHLLSRIPVVRTIYKAVKQVADTIFSTSQESFRKVLLVEFPRSGMWSIAFQTSRGFQEAHDHTQEDLVTVFIPTTPNPTSGFLMMMPKKDVKELEMSVDAAFKMIISLGMIVPEHKLTEHEQHPHA